MFKHLKDILRLRRQELVLLNSIKNIHEIITFTKNRLNLNKILAVKIHTYLDCEKKYVHCVFEVL